MSTPTPSRRSYRSGVRTQLKELTRRRILAAARTLFAKRGIDAVLISEIAAHARVAEPTVYALFKSKAGILRALMEGALFGPRFQDARTQLEGVSDPVRLIELSAQVARAIYESESSELGLLRGVSSFSPALRDLEDEFERLRFDMQRERIERLFAEGKQRANLRIADARRILWLYTSRDVYRMLVQVSGWSPDKYQKWLSRTLVEALVRS